ncbi:ran-binding protein 1 homolog c-like [Papaver somniferum]|uniref:ran-binding protein 1 homolog c-like n=1 Tax=Papaver somniferum TaxID=3469 RepID=UPI000E6F84A6|nr:ran-binding protein 1 homolog c-like [Papaver somniferum]
MSSKIFNYPEITELAEGFKHIEPKLEEEDEDALLRLKAKLYRFDKDGNQWKVRGDGVLKLLKHKQTKKVRLVMRQSKTLKVIVNHLVLPTILIQEHIRSQKSWFWHANDFSGGELKEEVFSARFESIENARLFKEMVLEAAESQVQKSKESKVEGATSLADDIAENLYTGEKKDVSDKFQFSTAKSQVEQKYEESKEGDTSLAPDLTEILYVGEKKDVNSTAECQVQKSEARKEGATSLAAYLTEKYIGEKKDIYNIFEFSTAASPSPAEI